MKETINHFDSGIWQVVTMNEIYIVDLNNYFVTRTLSETDNNIKLPRKWYKLVELYATVGDTMNLAVKLRHDTYPERFLSTKVNRITKIID